jgi:SAM-dependent methyltransferase
VNAGRDAISDRHWEAFAAREPYFAVLTAPRFLRANFTPDSEREFFATGEEYVGWLLRLIGERLVPEFAPVTTLEYGCGVGRLAIPFARRAGRVIAVDRSPAMLDAARREAARHGAGHIEFETPQTLLAANRAFDLVNCYGVLQRLPPAEGLEIVRSLVGRIGPGGVAVFHFPHRDRTSPLVQASRRIRSRFSVVNGVLNAVRRKPYGEPFIASYAYNLADVFRVIDDAFRARYGAPIPAAHLIFEHQQGFGAAVAIVQAPLEDLRVPAPARREDPVDVRRMIADTTVEELNRTAEEYFSRLPDWEHHLAKPFNSADDTPTILMGVAAMLQGLRLAPGMTVLEFGAGTGWLSRFLTQLGCRVVLLDVSPSALAIAREVYVRLPIIGERPRPVFLTFDGHRIDLPDGSVDRILSFHAFHHVPNPESVIQEFGRVLTPGGIAGFVEPGPTHSRDPQSQFEMRAYRVVENDVDIHAIWRWASAKGFADMKLAVHHGPPFHVSLAEFEAFMAGGPGESKWVNSTRAFLRHVRTFFLYKAGTERVDSRSADALACRLDARLASGVVTAADPVRVDVTVTNTGRAVWLTPDAEYGGVSVGVHVYEGSGKLLDFDAARQPPTMPSREIAPGDTITCQLALAPRREGRYILELDCVASRVTWFAQVGSPPARIELNVFPVLPA